MSSSPLYAESQQPVTSVTLPNNQNHSDKKPSSKQSPFELSISRITTGESAINHSDDSLTRNSWLTDFSIKFPLNLRHRVFASVSFGYDKLDYQWSLSGISPSSAFINAGDWENIQRYSASVSVIYKPEESWLFILSPKVQKAYAAGASSSDAISYGGVITGMYTFASGNTLGAGAAYLNDLDDVRVIPFVAIKWQINENWSLTNPFSAGFSGPAGLELRNQLTPNVELGFGGSRRTQRFLLNTKPQNAEIEEWVAFARIAWNVNSQLTLNTYGGFIFDGELTISNPEESVVMDNQGAAAISLDYRF